MPAVPPAPVAGKGIGVVPKSTAPTLDQVGVQYLLGRLNDPGTYVPGSPGYTVSNAGARAAETAAGNAAQAGLDKVYGQAVTNIQARNPLIQAAANQANSTMAADTAQRLSSIQGAADARAAAQQAASRAMGLSWTPQVSGASQQGDLLSHQASINTGAWKGLNDSNAQNNIDRNNTLASSFNYTLGQNKTRLAQAVSQALSKLVDRHVGGSAGKMVGGTTTSQGMQIAKALMGQGNVVNNRSDKASQAGTQGVKVSWTSGGKTYTINQ